MTLRFFWNADEKERKKVAKAVSLLPLQRTRLAKRHFHSWNNSLLSRFNQGRASMLSPALTSG
jgi:hypothetical protein